MKSISFIIPIYNGEKYIDRCLNSIFHQCCYKDIEIILINDASTDNTYNICCQYTNRYNNITILNNPKNCGVSYSRNIGIENASGKYIFFLDIDDFLTENSLEIMLKSTQSNSDLICFPIFSNKKNILTKYNLPLLGKFSQNDLFQKNLSSLFDVTISTWIKNKLYKTSIIKDNDIKFNVDMSYSEDMMFNLSFFPYSFNYIFEDFSILVYDRNVENSLSRQYESNLITQFFIQREYLDKFLQNNNIEINKYYYLDCSGLLTYCVYKVLNSKSDNKNKIKELNVLLKNDPKHLLPYFNLNNEEERSVFNFIKTQNFNILIKE